MIEIPKDDHYGIITDIQGESLVKVYADIKVLCAKVPEVITAKEYKGNWIKGGDIIHWTPWHTIQADQGVRIKEFGEMFEELPDMRM